ncbi:DUF3465 domain-containing protein [Marinomonas epiphytica]
MSVWANDALLKQAFEQQRYDYQVAGKGRVIKLLKDDLKGSKHQRFIVQLDSKQTLLVAHNIDLAPKIVGLKVGDWVAFYGEYEWNAKGGVIHWTHKDPRGKHPHGWLRHLSKQYD